MLNLKIRVMRNDEVANAFNNHVIDRCNTLHMSYYPQDEDSPRMACSYGTVIALGDYKSRDSMSQTTAKHLCHIHATPLWGAFGRNHWCQPQTYEDLARNIRNSFKNHQGALNLNRAKDRGEFRAMLRAYHFMRQFRRCDDATKVMETYMKLYDAWKAKHIDRAQREEELFNR